MIVRHIGEVDRRARERAAQALEIDVARQTYESDFKIYDLEHDEWNECLRAIEAIKRGRGLIDRIGEGVLRVTGDSEGAQLFVNDLYAYRDEKYIVADPSSCGEEPIPPEFPEILRGLSAPIQTTIPTTTTGVPTS